jgi:predicted  nucleic acid-binding Zn-ribbon protein
LDSANKLRDALSLALATEKGRREELDRELERWRQEGDKWRQEGEKWRQEAEQNKQNMSQAIKVSTGISSISELDRELERWRQEGAKWRQEGAKWRQEGDKWRQEGEKWRQEYMNMSQAINVSTNSLSLTELDREWDSWRQGRGQVAPRGREVAPGGGAEQIECESNSISNFHHYSINEGAVYLI